MAAAVRAGTLATGFRPVCLREMMKMKLNSLLTLRRSPSVATHVVHGSFRSTTSLSSNDYTKLSEQSSEKLTEADDSGPPRWFSPLECGCRSAGSPLLLFLPEIGGDGLGLLLHHKRLGVIFDIWCLHIPPADQTPLSDLVMLVDSTIKSEHNRAKIRWPIYLVGDSFGASLAPVVAAKNPGIDLVLILANPATSVSKSLQQSIVPLSIETILRKLKMIHEMQSYLHSNLPAVKAQTMVLFSGKDRLNAMNGERLIRNTMQHCEIRRFIGNDEPLFLDKSFDLVLTIKSVCYYRRGACIDYVADFMPPTLSDFKISYEPYRWMDVAMNPVMLSTTDTDEVVRGLAGAPLEGPVILVGNHMMLAMDAPLLLAKFYIDKNILIRGLAHPSLFERPKKDGGKLPDLSLFDGMRVLSLLPTSAANLYKLLSSKSHVLLYPGGVREALCRKLLLDCDDQMKIPPLKAFIEELTSEAPKLRSVAEGEVKNQFLHYPIFLPKLPDRVYFLFGKPISMQGREDILKNKIEAHQAYLEVQSEIQKCIAYLKEKRKKDPYRTF